MHKCMDWRSVTFDWNRARAFLVTVEEGSLSAAARALGMAQPTLGRQVAALEEELGVALFERSGKGLALTPSGLGLVDHVRAMGQAATALSRSASGQSQSVEGNVSITASEMTSAYVLPPILAKLRQRFPGITLHIVSSNSLRDLRRREADIALRNVRPSDPDLIARKLREDDAHLYAAQCYLDVAGPFETVEALGSATFIGFEENEPFVEGLRTAGVSVAESAFSVTCASQIVQWELLKQGVGLGVIPEMVAEGTPGVARAAPWMPPWSFDTWLVAHREVNTSKRVRLFYDALAEAIRSL